MQIHISDRQQDLPINDSKIKGIVDLVLEKVSASCDELGVYFVSSLEIAHLHSVYFQDDSITDCISFPAESFGSYCVLGEVFVCPFVAIEYVKQHPENGLSAYEETTLYLVHGILHLLGYDDIRESDRKKMHALQDTILQELIEKKLCLTNI